MEDLFKEWGDGTGSLGGRDGDGDDGYGGSYGYGFCGGYGFGSGYGSGYGIGKEKG